MKFHSSVIFVNDIQRSKEFYIKVLEQVIYQDFRTSLSFKSGLSIWQIPDGHIIKEQLRTEENSQRFELYFETGDMDLTYTRLQEYKVKFLHEIQEEPWGQRTMRFFDPDNHLVEIGEPVEVFVINLSKKGMNKSEIANKTGIPIELITQIISSIN